MKIFVSFVLITAIYANCDIKVYNRDFCQTVCDQMPDCGAFTFNKTTQTCIVKTRYGWKARQDLNYDSGFKNSYPFIEENVAFDEGDLKTCLVQ